MLPMTSQRRPSHSLWARLPIFLSRCGSVVAPVMPVAFNLCPSTAPPIARRTYVAAVIAMRPPPDQRLRTARRLPAPVR
jgi:hypothetical protein